MFFFVTAGATLWTVSFFVCILQLFAQPRILFDSDQFKQSWLAAATIVSFSLQIHSESCLLTEFYAQM